MQKPLDIAVVGSGLVGSLLSLYLQRAGHRVTVYDRSQDIRTVNFSGRSINLVMSDRGWKAVAGAGITDEIKKIGIAVDKRAIHKLDSSVVFQPYGKEGQTIYSLSRGILNRKMIDLAEAAGVTFKFEEKVWDIDLAQASIQTGETERGEWTSHQHDLVFGSDGAFSRVRHKMQRQSMFNYSQEFLNIGYKELHIPANPDGTHQLDPHSLHIWPRGNFMLMALANLDGSFTCTLFMPHEGDFSFASLTDKALLEAFFATHFPDTEKVIPDLVEDFFKNPTSFLVTMKCFPWTYQNKVALIGDACHAIVPFYGHGMNAGFEDITVLFELMDAHGNDWNAIFRAYENSRKPNADAIAELSYRNFMEMSSKTADENFLLQKEIERWFSDLHPDLWVPLYSRVTFSTEPYQQALEMGDFQNAIMEKVLALPGIKTNWKTAEVEAFILKELLTENRS